MSGCVARPKRQVLAGVGADVRGRAGAPQNVVTVPRTAITYSLYGDSVYVVKPDEKKNAPQKDAGASDGDKQEVFVVERRFVTTGQIREERVAITSGLAPGEQVVTTGQLKLKNGSRVVIDNSQELKPPATRPLQ